MVVCHSTLASAGGTSHDILLKEEGRRLLEKLLSVVCHFCFISWVECISDVCDTTYTHVHACTHTYRKEKHIQSLLYWSLEPIQKVWAMISLFFFIPHCKQNQFFKFTQFNSAKVCMFVSCKRGSATLLYSAQITNSCANGSVLAKGRKKEAYEIMVTTTRSLIKGWSGEGSESSVIKFRG